MYSADDDLNGIEVKVCDAVSVEVNEPFWAMYSTKYWEKICTTLADVNPREVSMSFAPHTKLDYTAYIRADDSVEIVLAGKQFDSKCPTIMYFELKQLVHCAMNGAENGK